MELVTENHYTVANYGNFAQRIWGALWGCLSVATRRIANARSRQNRFHRAPATHHPRKMLNRTCARCAETGFDLSEDRAFARCESHVAREANSLPTPRANPSI
jgi:hypothetical protein